jgi:hypothetical protein
MYDTVVLSGKEPQGGRIMANEETSCRVCKVWDWNGDCEVYADEEVVEENPVQDAESVVQ